ncbi:serine hydrolase [Tumidithrix elongata RA019]|uniref:Serine hydrolase n=1 Tax=Tumidithrix elongata BACA0141 TaxID=2716417 RepID=A0AAW9Q7N6_9CYAN|nr:serine hydrolase [Tumidithrix elongata RA019]
MKLFSVKSRISRIVLAFLLGLFLTQILFEIMPVPPAEAICTQPKNIGDGWNVSTPELSGFDAPALCQILTKAGSGRANIHSVIVERHGRLVAEFYRQGKDRSINILFGLWRPFSTRTQFSPTTLHDMRSISKSIVGLLVGIAQQKGRIGSLSTPILQFYPENSDLRSPEKDAVTLEHLLTMSSGLQWNEGALPNDETRLFWEATPSRYLFNHSVIAKPSQVFNYNSGGTMVLSDILTRTSGKSLKELVKAELFNPLEIADWEWVSNLHGRELAFTGLRMRPRDLVKIGRMMLDRGRWRDRQVVPEAWVAASLSPQISTGFKSPPTASDDLKYSYQWWGGNVNWHGKSLRWSAGFGNGGQRLFIVPDLDLAIATTAGDYESREIVHIVNVLFEDIVSSVSLLD